MRVFLSRLFIHNWPRKCVSLFVAIFLYFAVSHSLTATKTLSGVSVRVINVPAGMTVEGMQANGLLSRRITLSFAGNKSLLDELTPNDFEVVLDAKDAPEEWLISVSKKNLFPLNPEIDLLSGISRVSSQSMHMRLSKLITDKIPVLVTQPIGEPPRDYQYIDIWPYKLQLAVSGPEEVLKRLKAKGLKLTFNMSDITKAHLDNLSSSQGDVVSFFVPEEWKRLSVPLLSDAPIEINDPQVQMLRIDFLRSTLLPLDKPLPISLFVPPSFLQQVNSDDLKIAMDDFLHKGDGYYLLTAPLSVKGVSQHFLKIVRDMLEISIIVVPRAEREKLEWCVQVMNPRVLEDKYVALVMSESLDDELREMQPKLREEYLRNRFRNYMQRMQLHWPDDSRFEMRIELKGSTIAIKENAPVHPHK